MILFIRLFECRNLSEKYAPLDWNGYFDREEDVKIPDTDDASFYFYLKICPIFINIFLPAFSCFMIIIVDNVIIFLYFCFLGLSRLLGWIRWTCCVLSPRRWLFGVSLFFHLF